MKLALTAVLLLVGGAALGDALASAPVQVEVCVALGAVLVVTLSAMWVCWFRWAREVELRRQALEAWRDWPECRSALKKDEARRKAIRSQRP